MELSKRLRAVASFVTAGYRLADIGTDHAYIPIELVRTGHIPQAIAMDVNQGPLERAEENIREHGLSAQIRTRLSDGFSALEPGEADSAVIAGMGGGLTIRILREGERVVSALRECVLQPQSEIEKVRAFLLEEGFLFIAEDMVEEDGKYYPMMKVLPPRGRTGGAGHPESASEGSGADQSAKIWDETELRYGKYLLKNKHPVLRQFLEREQRIKSDILKGLERQDSERIFMRRKELEEELQHIEKGLRRYAV